MEKKGRPKKKRKTERPTGRPAGEMDHFQKGKEGKKIGVVGNPGGGGCNLSSSIFIFPFFVLGRNEIIGGEEGGGGFWGLFAFSFPSGL